MNNQIGSAFNYCNLPPNADIFFGSGGSDGIIAVLNDKAYKYFPIFIYQIADDKDDEKIKKIINYNKYEINVVKELTNKFIKTNLTHHIVKYYGHGLCDKIPTKIFNMCGKYADYLLDKNKTKKQCNLLFEKGYPRKLVSPMYVLEMEKATGSLESEIENISKEPWKDIEIFLDRLFFQVFYTLETIKKIYPNYTHNDLFIRNILTQNIGDSKNKYLRYHYKNKTFDLPANGLFIKINDFGMNYLSEELCEKYNVKDISDTYRDYFSIIYDVYNGGNLGGKSLKSLIKDKKKLEKIDKYFSNFLNIKNINKIIKNEKKHHLDWYWSKTQDKQIVKLLGLKSFNYYIENFVDIYSYDAKNDILMEFGK